MIHLAQTSQPAIYRALCGIRQPPGPETSAIPQYDIPVGELYVRAAIWWFGKVSDHQLWWGYVPGWIHDWGKMPRLPWSTMGVERAPVSRAFRHAWRAQRCLVPVDAVYLWRGRGTRDVQRYCIRRQDHRPMLLAGLWDFSLAPKLRKNAVDKEHRAFCLLTTPAPPDLQGLFARAPLILSPSVALPWVSPATSEDMEIREVMIPDPAPLDAYPVDNDARDEALWVPTAARVRDPAQPRRPTPAPPG